MQMIPPILNDTGDCCCQNCPQCNNCGCVPGGDGCICRGDKSGDSIESAITCDLTWKEKQPNGKYKYYKVVSGSSHQNMPVVLPTASLKKRGVVQLTNELSDRQDLALTPKGAKTIKTELDSETAERIAKDADLQSQIDKEKADRAKTDSDLFDRITQETADRKKADSALSTSITNVRNRVTSAESKVDSALSKANNAVTGVTTNGDATVTVTKADGSSKSFTINNVAHASSADSATNATHATSADTAEKATTADTATNANHATNADNATKATSADHAKVADRLASGSELDTSTVNFKKYVLTTALVQKGVDTHTINRENIGNGNYHFTYQYSFDITFTFPKQIGNASNIVVDAINLVVTDTGAGGLNKLTTRNVIGGLEFGTSNTKTFTFYGPQLDTTLDSTSIPTHNPIFVQGNIVVYVNDITYNKVD